MDWYTEEISKDVFKQVADLLGSISDEFYKDLFGDHVEITVSRDGTIQTDEYEHD